ncbi:MAG: TIGR00730 family Rossman fold protein [Bacteroidales bacterium]
MIKSVCVYSASSTKIHDKYFDAAYRLGKVLGQAGITCVNGGSNKGLMKTVSESTMEHGGKTIGVIPAFMIDEGWENRELNELIITDSMHDRKEKMAELADAVVALPGGCGTLEELLEIITWKQLGLFENPVIILNFEGFYNPLIEMLDKAVSENFMREVHREMFSVVNTPEEVLEAIKNAPRWDTPPRKFAAI